jgi:methanogenic corrinoid protein MtbC1
VAAARTGLTPDVLRVWERRYGAVRPGRSAGRQRFYSDADIERLRLLRLATLPGRSISQVVKLATDELARMVEEDAAAQARTAASKPAATAAADEGAAGVGAGAGLVERGLALTRDLDSEALEGMLGRAAATMGVTRFLESVAGPLLCRVGDEWHAGRLSPAHEHLASALVRRVTAAAMQALNVAPDAPNLVVATLTGERHEAGALYVAASAMAQGWRVTYLGTDLPGTDIAEAARATGARAVAVSIVYPMDRRQAIQELRLLHAELPPSVPLVVGGAGAAAMAGELGALGIRVAARLADVLPHQP